MRTETSSATIIVEESRMNKNNYDFLSSIIKEDINKELHHYILRLNFRNVCPQEETM